MIVMCSIPMGCADFSLFPNIPNYVRKFAVIGKFLYICGMFH